MIDKNKREFLVALGVISVAVLISFAVGFCVGTNIYPNIKVVENNITHTITIQKELQPLVTINNYTFHNYTNKYFYAETKNELINVIRENAEERDYELGVWDCNNYTDNDYSDLSKLGYQVDKFSTHIRDKNTYHALIGVYIFIEATTGQIISPSKYGYYGIDAGLLKEFNSSKTINYDDQEHLSINSFQICRGLK